MLSVLVGEGGGGESHTRTVFNIDSGAFPADKTLNCPVASKSPQPSILLCLEEPSTNPLRKARVTRASPNLETLNALHPMYSKYPVYLLDPIFLNQYPVFRFLPSHGNHSEFASPRHITTESTSGGLSQH